MEHIKQISTAKAVNSIGDLSLMLPSLEGSRCACGSPATLFAETKLRRPFGLVKQTDKLADKLRKGQANGQAVLVRMLGFLRVSRVLTDKQS
jgi:hypothetical protein